MNFAVIGAGFWSPYQIAAWQELKKVRCIAICDRNLKAAQTIAGRFGIPAAYDSVNRMFNQEKLDFVDIITPPASHSELVHAALENRIPVICQKPMATSLNDCREMVAAAKKHKTKFLIHENWRWQTAMRALASILRSGKIGKPFRARIEMCSGFPVFKNQPGLKKLREFIIADLGSHLLDLARFLFGEAVTVYCKTTTVQEGVRGEDVATIVLEMAQGTTVICNMAYAGNFLEHDRFPETFLFIEGKNGSLELGADFWIKTTTKAGTKAHRHPPPGYKWSDPQYAVVQASLVPCNENLLSGIMGGTVETSAMDNLKSMQLVFGAYASSARGTVVKI